MSLGSSVVVPRGISARDCVSNAIPAIDIFTKGITAATRGVERDVTGVEFVPPDQK
jgi:hypothetical protein